MDLQNEIIKTGIALKDQYFDLPGLSVYSSIGVSTLRNHIRRGLPSFKVGGKILVRKSEFDQWIEQFRLHKNQDISRIVDEAISRVKSGKSDV